MGEPFDLDAAKAARAEARGEQPMFIFGGQKFTLPPELPAEFAYLLNDAKEAFRFLLGDDFDDFWAHRPSKEDLVALIGALGKAYGTSLPESAASGGSSPATGGRSRPTSPATTRRTSGKPSTGRSR